MQKALLDSVLGGYDRSQYASLTNKVSAYVKQRDGKNWTFSQVTFRRVVSHRGWFTYDRYTSSAEIKFTLSAIMFINVIYVTQK